MIGTGSIYTFLPAVVAVSSLVSKDRWQPFLEGYLNGDIAVLEIDQDAGMQTSLHSHDIHHTHNNTLTQTRSDLS